jgi:5-hydroxyisourate hydrolase
MTLRPGPITTHVLDTARGLPARGISVTLEMQTEAYRPRILGTGRTDDDGRLRDLLWPGHVLEPGTYRLIFDTAAYFAATNTPTFYPSVQIAFTITAPTQHYHVPLLLSPYGYSTYRGT